MATAYEEMRVRFGEFMNTETGANVFGAYIGVAIGTLLNGIINDYLKPTTDAKKVLDRLFVKVPTAFGFFVLGSKLKNLLRWGAYGASLGVQLSLLTDVIGLVVPASTKSQIASAIAGKLRIGQLVAYEEPIPVSSEEAIGELPTEELPTEEIPLEIQDEMLA